MIRITAAVLNEPWLFASKEIYCESEVFNRCGKLRNVV